MENTDKNNAGSKNRRVEFAKEKKLKQLLLKNLIDDGKGHKHAAYARRLAKFNVNIVPLDEDPNFTAAVDSENRIVYIGEGFLQIDDNFSMEKAFDQLNVIIRHELSHDIMKHTIRFIKQINDKYSHLFGNDIYDRLVQSGSFFEIFNILADSDISNKRYTEEDKKIVRNMKLAGATIGGIVTEDYAIDWRTLSLEEMYERTEKIIEQLQQDLLTSYSSSRVFSPMAIAHNPVLQTGLKLLKYTDINSDANLPLLDGQQLSDWIANDCKIPNRYGKLTEIKDSVANIVKKLYSYLSNHVNDYIASAVKSGQNVVDVLQKIKLVFLNNIARTKPLAACELLDPITGEMIFTQNELVSDGEKYIALNVIKQFFDEYIKTFNEVSELIKNNKTVLTKSVLEDILKNAAR